MSFLDTIWEAIRRVFSDAQASSPSQPCPGASLTEKQAQEWFDKFKARKDIPWNYPNDCCYNRAHVMALELQAAGVTVGKAWNYAPSLDKPLRVATADDPAGYVEWGYHVAPTVPVRDADGNVVQMVIDPSIASGPITPEQWKALQGQPDSTLVLTNADPYYRAADGRTVPAPTDEEVQAIFDEHRMNRAANWPS